MTGAYRFINLAEAALWIGLGAAVAIVSLLRPHQRGERALLAMLLVAFGLSDLMETETGAWWRPWWLLLWKVLCVACLLAWAARHILRGRRAGKPTAARGEARRDATEALP